MAKFMIEPHFRLQEWVAEEKGYFVEAGLDYEFREFIRATGGAHHRTAGKAGAFQSIEKGREANVTCACHWTVNVAASRGHTKLYADAYSVAPSGIFVPATRRFARRRTWPACLFRSATSRAAITRPSRCSSPTCRPTGSTCRSARACCSAAWKRSSTARRRPPPLFNGPYYFAEQLGFRKVIDSTFMIAAMINGDPDLGDMRPVLPGAAPGPARHRPAARALHALLPERVSRALPCPHGHAPLGTGRAHRVRALQQGRLRESFEWIAEHGIFAGSDMGSGRYEDAVVSQAMRASCPRSELQRSCHGVALGKERQSPSLSVKSGHVAARQASSPGSDCRQYGSPQSGVKRN